MSAAENEAARRLLDACRARGLKLATAESCTGGLVAAALTEIAGSSEVFDRAFVTYSNEAKQQMLGVSAATLRNNGAVSRATAEAMAQGALLLLPSRLWQLGILLLCIFLAWGLTRWIKPIFHEWHLTNYKI